jgi:hypothetical protein
MLYPLPGLAGNYTQAKAVNHSSFRPKLPGVTTKREDDLDYLLAFVDQAAISGNALLLRAADSAWTRPTAVAVLVHGP